MRYGLFQLVVLIVGLCSVTMAYAQPQAKHLQKMQSFDADPRWEGFNNRVPPKQTHIVKQDFGASATHFATQGAGEIGGAIQRSNTPASYAAKIEPLNLQQKISASGTFAITASHPGAGIFFGFFNSQQPGGSGRPIGSLGLHFDFEGHGGRLAVRLITGSNKSCGTFITPYLPGKFRPTPLRNDGTRYRWTLDYDPAGAGNLGQFSFTLQSDTHQQQEYGELSAAAEQEAEARFPRTKTFHVDLPAGYKEDGAMFDRFGIHNMMKSGGFAKMYFADLTCNGDKLNLADSSWVGVGNRATFEDKEQVGAHDFGFSPETAHAGGKAGEVGGGFWRSGDFGYYADRIGRLDLSLPLVARGKVKLIAAGPDSDMFFGWFNSASRQTQVGEKQDFLGIHVGGPTRVGHYFVPVYATSRGTRGKVEQGPVLTPGKVFDWSLRYDPEADQGLGQIEVTLGKESVSLPLKRGQKTDGATFDRFGFFTSTIGGQMVKIFFDDLEYTTNAANPQ